MNCLSGWITTTATNVHFMRHVSSGMTFKSNIKTTPLLKRRFTDDCQSYPSQALPHAGSESILMACSLDMYGWAFFILQMHLLHDMQWFMSTYERSLGQIWKKIWIELFTLYEKKSGVVYGQKLGIWAAVFKCRSEYWNWICAHIFVWLFLHSFLMTLSESSVIVRHAWSDGHALKTSALMSLVWSRVKCICWRDTITSH